MTSNVIAIRGASRAPVAARSSMETLIITIAEAQKWQTPPFQRPIMVNRKVEALVEELKQTETLPGVITLGRLKNDGTLYKVDGQHRIHGFIMSGLPEVIADVRVITFDSMAEMGAEFEVLNEALVRMRPDDVLRAKEFSSRAMQRIRAEVDCVGYDSVRRGGSASPMVSMSLLLKAWMASANETPSPSSSRTAAAIANELDGDEQSVAQLCRFMHLAQEAWGRDPEYYRLWGALNLTMTMWLYRHLVLNKQSAVKRHIQLTDTQFQGCMMSLSADTPYLEWLVGRNLRESDRAPCYDRIRRIFVRRLEQSGIAKVLMPQPAWVLPPSKTNKGRR